MRKRSYPVQFWGGMRLTLMHDICGAGGCILAADLTLLLCPEGRSQPRQGRTKPLLNLQQNNFALFILFFCSFFFPPLPQKILSEHCHSGCCRNR